MNIEKTGLRTGRLPNFLTVPMTIPKSPIKQPLSLHGQFQPLWLLTRVGIVIIRIKTNSVQRDQSTRTELGIRWHTDYIDSRYIWHVNSWHINMAG